MAVRLALHDRRPRRAAAQAEAQAAGSLCALCRALPRAGAGGARRADRRRAGDAGVPVAVRRMIDFGFSGKRAADRQLFRGDDRGRRLCSRSASALRYYLVTTLGERIVADLRSDVFAHLTRLSPPFSTRARPAK